MIIELRNRKLEMTLNSFFILLFSPIWDCCCGLKAVVIWKKVPRHYPPLGFALIREGVVVLISVFLKMLPKSPVTLQRSAAHRP